MFSVNVLQRVRTENGWVRVPVRKTPQGKFVWDRAENGVYYLEWYEDGKRRRASAGTRPAEVLEARRRKILELKGRAIEQGRTVSASLSDEETAVPLASTIDAYLNHVRVNQKLTSYRRYRSGLANLREYFASKKYLNEISRGGILEYRDFRATKVDSPVTLNTEITMIRAFLYWCKEFRNLQENPAAKIKPRQVLQKNPSVYTDEEVTQMLQKPAGWKQALTSTGGTAGRHKQ